MFAELVRARAPEVSDRLTHPPFAVDDAVVERSRAYLSNKPRGPEQIQALVDFLRLPEPEGLGLAYDFQETGSAQVTLDRKRGNCVSFAMVLVGIGRGLGWPTYFVQVHTRRPETQEFSTVRAVSDHMAVVVPVKSHKTIVDFTGRIDEAISIEVIDDLTAYAHVLNNLSAQRVMVSTNPPSQDDWATALQGFILATRIQPELGRAWNNRGIALTHLGRFDEARRMYARALELDTEFGVAERNLTLMETRSEGDALVREAPPPTQ